MEFKGTNGSLTVERFKLSDDFLILDENGYQIAVVENEYIMDVEKTQANAILLSKAQEMLEMLKDILEQENLSQSAHDEITKLIKQATEI